MRFAFVACVFLAFPAYAQSVAPVSTTHHLHKLRAAKAMDLPFAPPSLGGPPWYDLRDPVPTETPDDGEDPRDTPPPVFFGEEIDVEGDAIVYIIDRSGSMSMGSPLTRLDRAKAELRRSIEGLAESMRFNVWAFDCVISSVWNRLMSANDAHKEQAYSWFESLEPRGGTGTGLCTAEALTTHQDCTTFVVLTDGAPGCSLYTYSAGGNPTRDTYGAARQRRMIKDANTQGAAVHVFGIDAVGQWRAWCQGVAADSNGGTYVDVP